MSWPVRPGAAVGWSMTLSGLDPEVSGGFLDLELAEPG